MSLKTMGVQQVEGYPAHVLKTNTIADFIGIDIVTNMQTHTASTTIKAVGENDDPTLLSVLGVGVNSQTGELEFDPSAMGIPSATTTDAGFMSATDKAKLDGIDTGANNYVHPTTSGNKHIPSGGSAGQVLKWSADGTAVWDEDTDTTYVAATASADGLMSSTDKDKLDNIDSNANNYTHPSYTARTGAPTTDQSPAFGGSFTISQITSDAYGHVTNAISKTITIPDTEATTSVAGLMSATDKVKLDGIDTMTGATSSANGAVGLVPAPTIAQRNYFLRGDGTWAQPYEEMTLSHLSTGTSTVAMVVSPKVIADHVSQVAAVIELDSNGDVMPVA